MSLTTSTMMSKSSATSWESHPSNLCTPSFHLLEPHRWMQHEDGKAINYLSVHNNVKHGWWNCQGELVMPCYDCHLNQVLIRHAWHHKLTLTIPSSMFCIIVNTRIVDCLAILILYSTMWFKKVEGRCARVGWVRFPTCCIGCERYSWGCEWQGTIVLVLVY